MRAIGNRVFVGDEARDWNPETSEALLEHCNIEKGTGWSDLRREHGYERPHSIKR